jgi:hypothetical protein
LTGFLVLAGFDPWWLVKFRSAMPVTIAAASWLELWYNQAALKIP